jgi:hypothetical protein
VTQDADRGLGPDAAPARDDRVAEVTVGDAVILYSPLTRRTTYLKPLLAAIWQLLDGTLTLDELGEDLAEAVGADLEEARRHVFAVAQRLRERGLLAGAEPTATARLPRPEPVAGPTPVEAPG